MIAQEISAYRRLAAKYGVRYRFLDYRPDICWDGTGILTLWDIDEELIPHDLAHYLVATPFERTQLEFGLGRAPGAMSGDVNIVTRRRCFTVEGQASLLGIFLQKEIEGHKEAFQTYEDHTWKLRLAVQTARKLLKRGFLVWHLGRLVPRAMVREPKKKDVFR